MIRRDHAVVVVFTTSILAGMMSAVLVHEAGHHVACEYLGYESAGIMLTLNHSLQFCKYGVQVPPGDLLFIQAAGGGTAVAIFGSLLAAFTLVLRRRTMFYGNHVRLFLLAGLVSQFINLVLEAGLNPWYNYTTQAIAVAVSMALIFLLERDHLPRLDVARR